MVIQATKWDWKRLAARLLLVPVLTGGSAAVAHAQTRAPALNPVASAKSAAPTPAPAGDAKGMLKDGRRALAEGRFNDARDLAQRAEASNPNGKWGLFDDTPNALRQDVDAAKAKAQKAESEQLAKQAKALFAKAQAKPSPNEAAGSQAERAANLDTALQMARRADQLHGPYTAWDLGDRPDRLVKEIEDARARMRALPPAAAVATAKPTGTKPTTVATAPADKPRGLIGRLTEPSKPAQPAVTPAVATLPVGAPSGVVTAGGIVKPDSVTPAAATTPAKPTTPVAVAPPMTPTTPVVPTEPPMPTAPVATAPVPAAPIMDLPAPTAPFATTPVPTTPDAVPVDSKKAAAIKLMAEGKQLIDAGDFVAAHAKYTEADKIGATFAPRDYNPGLALQELNARGVASIDRLLKEAQTQTDKRDFAKADAALAAAGEIASTLNLFPRPIEDAKTVLRTASAGKFGGPAPTPVEPEPEPLVQAVVKPIEPMKPVEPVAVKPTEPMKPVEPVAVKSVEPMKPTNPPGVASIGAAPGVATVGGTPKPLGSISGRQLMDQAALEYRKGDYDTARRLALQAHNLGGMQNEARGLLNQIDAQVFAEKQRTAVKSFDAALDAVQNKNHGHALGVLILIDPRMLPEDIRAKREDLLRVCKAELDKGDDPKAGVVAAGGMQPPKTAELQPLPGLTSPTAPGSARVGSADTQLTNPDSLADQADAMKRVTFQKLRGEGLKVQADAQAAFGRGDTEVAIRMLTEYSNRVKAANLEPASVALLLRPVDSRLEMFRVMRGQADALARETKDKAETKQLLAGRGAAEVQRQDEIQRLVRQTNALVKEKKYVEAERVALQAKQLDPDNASIEALASLIKITRRVKDAEQLSRDKEKMVLDGLNNAEREGPFVSTEDPVAIKLDASRRARHRGTGDDVYLRTMTPALYEIDLKLDKPITVEFNQTPLSEAIRNVQQLTALPVSWDQAALEAEAVSSAKPVSGEYKNLSTRNVLYLLLDNAGLSFVLEYDTVRITTVKKAKGRLFTKVFSVADLVTPIPNFALPDYANFDKMLNRNAFNSGKAMIGGLNTDKPGMGGPRGGGLGGATLTGTAATTPGIAGGGTLDNNPLAQSSNIVADRNTKHEQLIKLVTSMVRPHSWDAQGGAGKVEYFDLGSALVVNQTADVISEIQTLLEALRRLQDLAVAVEVRIISLSETWYERMGVNFEMNVKSSTTKFQPSLINQTFTPEPFINSINAKGTTVGLTPAGSFTPDLNVPVRASSFERAIPGFGGYPNDPGANGGISLGLAFLNDIQVYMFMEASQGDRRVNVMQAPKLTLFNGQTATISINDLQFFVTSVQVYSVNGQIVFIPENTPLPGPGQGGINLSLQAVVSADRRFVRINIPVQLSVQTGATVPLFPVTTFITPVFEGGSQGVPIPFTQFLQQPSFTSLNIQTTVVCPDGGTVLLGGLKTLGEGRNEFGPPFLSKVPYLNRLFKNVGIGRETTHIMIMITPRIIINAEEEINQTESGPLGTRPGQ